MSQNIEFNREVVIKPAKPTAIARFFIQRQSYCTNLVKIMVSFDFIHGFTNGQPSFVSSMYYDKDNALSGLCVTSYLNKEVGEGSAPYGYVLAIDAHEGCEIAKHRSVYKFGESTIKRMEKLQDTLGEPEDFKAYLRHLFITLKVKDIYYQEKFDWRGTEMKSLDSIYDQVLADAQELIGIKIAA